MEKYTGIECVGYLPRNEKLSVESRHLGLKQSFELKDSKELEEKKQLFKEIAEKCLDLKRIYEIAEEFEIKGSLEKERAAGASKYVQLSYEGMSTK